MVGTAAGPPVRPGGDDAASEVLGAPVVAAEAETEGCSAGPVVGDEGDPGVVGVGAGGRSAGAEGTGDADAEGTGDAGVEGAGETGPVGDGTPGDAGGVEVLFAEKYTGSATRAATAHAVAAPAAARSNRRRDAVRRIAS
ncbi:hypothetical protein [Streptomyces ipomoeae]|uniref:Uncharacterized protein n=1 Tax=Streptomyces ipomoeae 91-03 TaxID=698759 RepID=L1KU89_9ACTN|nr:hypothetical protein [Streptomyces ipomoeae]EKX64025.1 hypothetical protein STRIP9103_07628 [Streptomyces ipomoeae 91-03]